MAAVEKKVVAFVGSARKKHTHNAVQQLMRNLQALGDIEYEIVPLGGYTYYRDHGWFEYGCYYPARLSPVKCLAGDFFDWTSAGRRIPGALHR